MSDTDAAWAALVAEFTCGSFGHDTAIARHRPLIEAALAASPADGAGVDVERLIDAVFAAGYDPLGHWPHDEWQTIVNHYNRAALEGASDGTREGSG